jgi:hypothetical protein
MCTAKNFVLADTFLKFYNVTQTVNNDYYYYYYYYYYTTLTEIHHQNANLAILFTAVQALGKQLLRCRQIRVKVLGNLS